MTLIEIKSTTITGKGQISIPRNMRKLESFKTGSKIAILSYKDHIELRPMNQVNSKIGAAIASEKSLSRDWNSKEDEEAWKDL